MVKSSYKIFSELPIISLGSSPIQYGDLSLYPLLTIRVLSAQALGVNQREVFDVLGTPLAPLDITIQLVKGLVPLWVFFPQLSGL